MNTPLNNLKLREALSEKFGKLPYSEYAAALEAAQFVLEWQLVNHAIDPAREFAKLFTVDGEQVLIQITEDEAHVPTVEMTTRINKDTTVCLGVGYPMPDAECALEKAMVAFSLMGQEAASEFRKKVLLDIGAITEEGDEK